MPAGNMRAIDRRLGGWLLSCMLETSAMPPECHSIDKE
jgi:hypothetical protein